jgi:hypothetical protein
MCRQSDQSWRAASLGGGKLWSDPALQAAAFDGDEGMDVVEEEKRATGNVNRRLWKKMCRKLASSVSCPLFRLSVRARADLSSLYSRVSIHTSALCTAPFRAIPPRSFPSARAGRTSSGLMSTPSSNLKLKPDSAPPRKADSGVEDPSRSSTPPPPSSTTRIPSSVRRDEAPA